MVNQSTLAQRDNLHSAVSGVRNGLKVKRVKEALSCELVRPLIGRTQRLLDGAGKNNKGKKVGTHDGRKKRLEITEELSPGR